jgi:hypothetical protein
MAYYIRENKITSQDTASYRYFSPYGLELPACSSSEPMNRFAHIRHLDGTSALARPVKSKTVPLNAMEALGGRGGIAPTCSGLWH